MTRQEAIARQKRIFEKCVREWEAMAPEEREAMCKEHGSLAEDPSVRRITKALPGKLDVVFERESS